MAALPSAASFTGAGVTEGQFKTAMTDLRTFLADLLGTDGVNTTARTALGVGTAQTPTFAGINLTGAAVVGGQVSAAGGSAAAPGVSFTGDLDTGIFRDTANQVGVAVSGVELMRFSTTSADLKRGVDAVQASAFNLFKARGSVAAPTVITTGDQLGDLAAYGYVGNTNGYVESSRIRYSSEGAISDSATGIGGVIELMTRAVGGNLATALRIDSKNNVVQNNAGIATGATDGFFYLTSMAGAPSGAPTAYTNRMPMVYDRTNNKIYVNNAGTWKQTAALT